MCTCKLESTWEIKNEKPITNFEDDDEQMDEVFSFLSGIVKSTVGASQLTDEIAFILDVLLSDVNRHCFIIYTFFHIDSSQSYE